ncbi:glutamine synthetase [Selenomonas sp. TAMA-11512]|uniref:glutamine synthetase n=1 Tax=Selenomonas sp. TAMA-11512 TaxID=3095337 RepID=UPI003087B201|nr:glutamine synthetase [Selenomonas sp. TAMA-11512]
MEDLLYVVPANSSKDEIRKLLAAHPEVRFVSVVGIDLAGNDTDEKIPVRIFLEDMDKFYAGTAVQTDGSSVVLNGIATLHNAKVDMPIDPTVNWFVDYNYEHTDMETGLPVGTLRIPSFIIHEGKRVDSRAVLTDTLSFVRDSLVKLLNDHPRVSGFMHVDGSKVRDIVFTSATELEFWVKTPLEESNIEDLSTSQVLQEQYWQRTHGSVRTAMEETLLLLDRYGFEVEMGHKEVGGLKGQIDESGRMTHVCEQLEIDWKYAETLQAADNELFVRTLVREVFRENGLEVIFKAKPMIGLAGNGEHLHIGLMAVLEDGKKVNLFTAEDMTKDFMSALGYGAIMGLLKNYEVINPFVSATNDSLNRLKPGFEAPVCIVTSLGDRPDMAARNRTILAGLIRDLKNPYATRFELRACNPYSNIYLVAAAVYMAVLDGIRSTITRTTDDLLAELSKEAGADAQYLEKDRAYRSEIDVFDDFTEAERNRLFGAPPETVWENMQAFERYPDKLRAVTEGGALRTQIIDAFKDGALLRWKMEVVSRIIPENRDLIRKAHEIKTEFMTDQDSYMWNKINGLRSYLAKDSVDEKCVFTRLKTALLAGDYGMASRLQVEMYDRMEELKALYDQYQKNMI